MSRRKTKSEEIIDSERYFNKYIAMEVKHDLQETHDYPDENGLPRNGHKIADDLVLYCLRHTFCTDLQKAGVPLNIARIIMGHEDIRVTASIYTHTDSEDVRAAGEKLNSYFSA